MLMDKYKINKDIYRKYTKFMYFFNNNGSNVLLDRVYLQEILFLM